MRQVIEDDEDRKGRKKGINYPMQSFVAPHLAKVGCKVGQSTPRGGSARKLFFFPQDNANRVFNRKPTNYSASISLSYVISYRPPI